jgi:hypothetical protein
MEKRRILDFKGFINESYDVNEGFLSKIGEWIKKIGGWAGAFLKSIASGEVRKYESGPKTGLPTVMLFLPQIGSVLKQMEDYDRGISSIKEARIPLEYTGEDGSVRNINATKLKDDILKLYRSKDRGGRAKPIFIYGAPGIGKTQIVGQAADELGVPVLKMDLQFMNPEDFLGIPSTHEIRPVKMENGIMKDTGAGFTRSNPPRKLPQDNGPEGKGGIVFMDEMNRANKIVLSSIMQFVQEGRIDEYQLPDKWIIVAAGNRPEEAEVADFDFALADRFTIKNYVPELDTWAEWAKKNDKILPELVSFLNFNKDLFHYLDADKKSLNYPTPRSWADGALILHDEIVDSGVDSWRDINSSDIRDIFFDQVGPEAAGKFIEFLDILRNISEEDIKQFVTDPENAIMLPAVKKNMSILYGLQQMAFNMVDDGTVETGYRLASYFNRYKELESLSALYKRMISKYPEWKQLHLGTPEEQEYKEALAVLIDTGAQDKGLY